MATIKARLAGLRRGTAAQWSLANPVLLDGEPGYETDTKRLRIGDGVTQFTSLPYVKMSATDAQAASALLAAFAALGAAADKLGYFSGPAAMAVTDLTAYGRQLIGAADINAARAVLGIGSIASLNTINFANMAAGAYILAAAGIAANKTVDNRFPTVKAVAEYVDATAIGVGQTWQNVLASRVTGTDYTNNTGRPIVVNIQFNQSGSTNPTTSLIVGGVTVAQGGQAGVAGGGMLSAIVPAGAIYRCVNFGGNAPSLWAELRS